MTAPYSRPARPRSLWASMALLAWVNLLLRPARRYGRGLLSYKMTGKCREYRHLTPGSPTKGGPLDRGRGGTSSLPYDRRKHREFRQAAAESPALFAARLLRRRGQGHRFRGAGAEALRRPGLCPPRDRPQPLCGREPEGQGRGVRRGTRRDPRHQGSGDLFGPWRAEIDPGAVAAAGTLPSPP